MTSLVHSSEARYVPNKSKAHSNSTGADLEEFRLPQLLLSRRGRRAIGRLLLADTLALRAPQFRPNLKCQRTAFTKLQACSSGTTQFSSAVSSVHVGSITDWGA
ncbi:hypothetical protein LMG31886_22010 [Xanthomonas hydrangeae]|nr:hypothetical protein LMG31886_22010 [Xanthomonas hydrangeae]CAD7735139.1 hypothetical protein LMG31886_22010 [Xanthomonas hydrangeae]